MEKPAELSPATKSLPGSTQLDAPSSTTDASADDAKLLENIEFDSFVNRLEKRWTKPKLEPNQSLLQRLGRFEIRRELGRGRFGVVFLAWDPQLHRHVALKVPQFDAAMDPDLRERFRGEAQAAGKLQHPGIISIHDVGQHAGVDYIAMMYVDGMTLAERLKLGPMPPQDAAKLVIGLGAAVQHAHDQDVIHRDLKPSNILIDKRDQPHVMDFGLALQLSESAIRATATGQVLGTPAYMSPEQATGKSDVGPLSDVYSLGVILYEVITGRPPFQAATFAEAVEFIVNHDPLPPSKLNPKLPRELDAITFKCLEKNPAARYESAADLADDLQRYLDGRPIRARALGPVQRAWRWCRKYPSRALLLLTTLIAVALLVATSSVYSRWQFAANRAREQEAIAEKQRLDATLSRARNLITRRLPGWSNRAREQLQIAVATKASTRDPAELRALGIETFAGFDLQEAATIDTGMLIDRIAFSPDGKLLAVGELKGTLSCRIVLFDTVTLKPKHTFTVINLASTFDRLSGGKSRFQDGVRELAFSGNSRYLAVGMRFGSINCYDLQEPEKRPQFLPVSNSRELARVAFSANGKSLFAVTKLDDEFLYWPDWQKETKPVTNLTGRTLSIAAAPQGDAFFMQNLACNELRMLDQSLHPRLRYSPLNNITKGMESDLVTDSTGRLLAGESGYGLRVYETTSGLTARHLKDDTVGDESTAEELQMSSDGLLLSAFSNRGIVRLFDVANGRQIMRLTLDRHDFQDVALDPQKRWLAISNDRELKFWSIHESKVRRVVTSPADLVEDIRFSPDGKVLACAATSGSSFGFHRSSLMTIDCSSGLPLATRSGGFNHLSFTPGWSQVTWQRDGRSLVWNSPFGTTICSADKLSSPLNCEPIPLMGPTSPIDLKVTSDEGDTKKTKAVIKQIPHPHSTDRQVWSIRPNGAPVRIRGRLKSPLAFHRQAPTLLFSVKLDASFSYDQAFTVVLNGLTKEPEEHLPPIWMTGKQSDFQWFSVCLPHSIKSLEAIDLQIKPARHLRSFQLEQISCVALDFEVEEPSSRDSVQELLHLTMATKGNRLWGVLGEKIRCWSYPDGKSLGDWTNPQHLFTGAGNQRCVESGIGGTLVGNRDGRVHWLTPEKPQFLTSWPGPGKEVVAAALCEPAGLALVAAENGKVRGISIPSGEIQFDLQAHDEAITAIAATDDANTLVTASVDRRLRVWHRSGNGFELYSQLPDATSQLSTLRISPNGRYVAAVARATDCVELWDMQLLRSELKSLGIR